MRRAAIYARYSTDLQRDRSIEDQVALCRGFAERQGLTVAAVYSDRARTSASLIGREGLQDLLAEIYAGRFEAVIVEAFDRISRDQENLAHVHKRLCFANVELLTVNDGAADTLRIGMHGLFGELWMEGHRKKVHRGQAGVFCATAATPVGGPMATGRCRGGRANGKSLRTRRW